MIYAIKQGLCLFFDIILGGMLHGTVYSQIRGR